MTTARPGPDSVPGGPRLGLVLVGILLIAVNTRAAITAVGPVLADVQVDLGLSATASSALISLPLIAFAAFSPLAPWLAARIGIERALGLGLAVLAVGILVRSGPWGPGLWVGTFVLGAAIAVMNVVLPALIKRDYPTQVGTMTGAYMALSGFGAALGSGFAVPLAGGAQDGWRLSLGVWAGLALIALGVFLPQLRRAVGPAGPSSLPGLSVATSRLRSPWRSPLGWFITIYMGTQSTAYYAVLTWWPAIERSYGVSATTAGWHQFAFQVVGVAANLVVAFLLHRLRDPRWIAVATGTLFLVGFAGLLLVPELSLVWLLCAGAGGGGSIVLVLSLFGLRTEHHHQAAQLSGMAQSFGYVMAASGPLLIGVLHDRTGSWTVPLIALCGLILVQGTAGVLASKPGTIGTKD